jgi:hypothetical protein
MNLEGKKIANLLILKRVGTDKWGSVLWLCRCVCGKEVIKSAHRLCAKKGSTKSCGCGTPKRKYRDLTGQKFGRWTVLKLDERTDKNNRHFWLCECECGNKKVVGGHFLWTGGSKSCGCYNAEVRLQGLSLGEAGFNVLINRFKRSAKERNLEFTLLEEEFKELVLKDCYYCGTPPLKETRNMSENSIFIHNSIDRIDNSKGYIKENCVPCCEKCNGMKYTYTEKEFINQCSLIASRQPK